MSEFNGRRAPNFSQYLEDLNAIPSPYDQALQQQQQQQDSFNLDSELSLFTNAEFFDFDKFGDLSLPTFDSMDNDKSKEDTNEKDQNSDLKFLEFLNGKSYNAILNPELAIGWITTVLLHLSFSLRFYSTRLFQPLGLPCIIFVRLSFLAIPAFIFSRSSNFFLSLALVIFHSTHTIRTGLLLGRCSCRSSCSCDQQRRRKRKYGKGNQSGPF